MPFRSIFISPDTQALRITDAGSIPLEQGVQYIAQLTGTVGSMSSDIFHIQTADATRKTILEFIGTRVATADAIVRLFENPTLTGQGTTEVALEATNRVNPGTPLGKIFDDSTFTLPSGTKILEDHPGFLGQSESTVCILQPGQNYAYEIENTLGVGLDFAINISICEFVV